MEPKPFKSIDEQIGILQDRGMIIDDASRARNALETIGYYKLSGYSYPFRRKREGTNEIADEFTEGTTFEQVLAVYIYDETLREATAHELSRTEIAFRALIGHELGKTAPHLHLMPHELGPKAWDKDRARPTEEYRRWIEHYQTQLGTSDEDSVLHYKSKYRGVLPLWVAVQVLDWGALRTLFSFATRNQQEAISEKIRITAAELNSWLRCLNILRNICAHHARLFNRNFRKTPKLPDTPHPLAYLKEYVNNKAHPRWGNRCFLQLTLVQYLLHEMDLGDARTLPRTLAAFPPVGRLSPSSMGAPQDWHSLPFWEN